MIDFSLDIALKVVGIVVVAAGLIYVALWYIRD
jgi:hypothetical protein